MVMADMGPEELELTALSSLLSEEAVREAMSHGVTALSFQVPEHEKAWLYLVQRAEAGRTATVEDVRLATGVKLTAGVSDHETFVETLVARSTQRRAYEAIARRVERLASAPVDTVRELIADLGAIAAPTEAAHARYFDDVDARLLEFEAKVRQVEERGYVGWPTGLPTFDDDGDTWKPGELVNIQGATNAGKSFLLLWLTKNVYWRQRARVLFLSPENTVQDIEARLDPMIARELGLTLSVRGIRNGTQDREVYNEYMRRLAAQDRHDWVTRDSGELGVFTVGDIIAHARQHRPQVLAIDGFHLIRGDGKSWESMKHAAETVKGLAQALGMVVLTVSQAQRDSVVANDDAPTVGQAAYGLALNEAANRVISLALKTGVETQRIFKVPKNRDGRVVTDRRTLRFNVDQGDIGEGTVKVDEATGFVDTEF